MQAPLFHVVLISFVSLTDAFKILFYWAVDSDQATQDMVKANVAYAKAQGGPDCCDVMLSHYKGKPEDWGEEWYGQNVVNYHFGQGYKYHALKQLYNSEFCHKLDDIYEWVWALDSDIDIRQVDLKRLFALARESNSLIVSPTFTGNAGQWTTFNNLLELEDAETDSSAHQINVIGKPDEKCAFRHATYVEMTAPLLNGKVLAAFFQDGKCEHCIGDKAEWGLDRIWCSITKKTTGVEHPCAYLDETPVLHLDWHRAQVNNDF